MKFFVAIFTSVARYSNMMGILLLMFLLAVSNGEILKLEFLEEGQYYNQTVILKENSVEFDVPQHANIQQTQYLYDYDAKLIVMKSTTARKCYAYKMQNHEATPDEIKAGVLQFHGHFPENQYMVVTHNIFPVGFLDSKNTTPKILNFCGSFPVIESAVFNSTKEVEQVAKDQLLYQTISSPSRQKRSWIDLPRRSDTNDAYGRLLSIFDLIKSKKRREYLQDDPNIAKVKTCDFQTSRDESEFCLKRDNDSQNLDTVCKTTDSTCSRKLRCYQRNKKWHCQEGEHVYTDLVCCDLKCKELLPQPVAKNIDPLN